MWMWRDDALSLSPLWLGPSFGNRRVVSLIVCRRGFGAGRTMRPSQQRARAGDRRESQRSPEPAAPVARPTDAKLLQVAAHAAGEHAAARERQQHAVRGLFDLHVSSVGARVRVAGERARTETDVSRKTVVSCVVLSGLWWSSFCRWCVLSCFHSVLTPVSLFSSFEFETALLN